MALTQKSINPSRDPLNWVLGGVALFVVLLYFAVGWAALIQCRGQCTHDVACWHRCQDRKDCPAAQP